MDALQVLEVHNLVHYYPLSRIFLARMLTAEMVPDYPTERKQDGLEQPHAVEAVILN